MIVKKIDANGISNIGMAQLSFDMHGKNQIPRAVDFTFSLDGVKPLICLFEKNGKFKIIEVTV